MSARPNLALVLKPVSSMGRAAGILNVSGFVLAAFCQDTLAILGLSVQVVQSASWFLLVNIIGSLYLFYFGIKALFQVESIRSCRAI